MVLLFAPIAQAYQMGRAATQHAQRSYTTRQMRYSLLLLFLSFNCAGPATVAAGDIQIAEATGVKSCESVGVIEERVESPSDIGQLKERIREQVKERAEKLRATHLVFLVEETDESYGFAKAEAFRCK